MVINKIVSDLRVKKGYLSNGKLKKGKRWLAEHYGVSVDTIDNALNLIKGNDILVEETTTVVKPASVKNTVINSSKAQTYWVAGCLHMPWHNKTQLSKTLKYLQDIKLDGVILAGDILDINSLSFHDKGNVPIEGVTLEWEYKESLKAFNEIFKLIDLHEIPSKNLHFMYGNHEDRYLRTLKQVDGSKLGKALMSPEQYLGLEDKGFTIYKDFKRDTIELGDLIVNHGEYLNQHVTKKTIEVYKQSSLFFHTHRFQVYADGKHIGYNMGFGGDINAPIFNYAPRGMKSAWNNASALVTIIDNKAHVQPLLFINNKLVVNGKEV